LGIFLTPEETAPPRELQPSTSEFIIQGAETVGPEIDSASVGDISSVPEVDLTPLTMEPAPPVYWSPGRKATAWIRVEE